MARTAEELMTHHIGQMAAMRPDTDLDEALSDYSHDLSAITMLDGVKRTLGYRSLGKIMGSTFSFAGDIGMNMDTAFDGLKILYRKGTDNYVSLLVAMEPYTTFASFTYMVENDKAVYVTGYAKTPDGMPTLNVADEKFPPNPDTMAAIEAHMTHVKSGDLSCSVG